MEDAARVAFRTIIDYLNAHPEIKLVRYVLYGVSAFAAHQRVLEQVLAK